MKFLSVVWGNIPNICGCGAVGGLVGLYVSTAAYDYQHMREWTVGGIVGGMALALLAILAAEALYFLFYGAWEE